MQPFGVQLALAVIGPLITVVLGSLVVGGLLQQLSARAQLTRARNDRVLDQRRAESDIRHELISDMTSAASALYLASQMYWRADNAKLPLSREEVDAVRRELNDTYRSTRTAGEVIEARLRAYFDSNRPEIAWHKVMDLLTVRYFQLHRLDNDRLLSANAQGHQGLEHSGLTFEELVATRGNAKPLLEAYRTALQEAARAVLVAKFRA